MTTSTKVAYLETRVVRSDADDDVPRSCTKPSDAADIHRAVFGTGLDKEVLGCIGLLPDGQVTAVWRVSEGTSDTTFSQPTEVFRPAILHGAHRVVLVHNHPYATKANPSTADKQVTLKMVQAGELLGIDVVDSIVVTDTDFASCKSTMLDEVFSALVESLPEEVAKRLLEAYENGDDPNEVVLDLKLGEDDIEGITAALDAAMEQLNKSGRVKGVKFDRVIEGVS